MRCAVLRTVSLIAYLGVAMTSYGWEPDARMRPVLSNVITLKFVGDINGLRADATVSVERLPDYVLAAGRIQTRTASYGFTADMVGDSGFGTILDYGDGSRWQIKIQLTREGFAMISNPFGPGTPSTYYFKLVRPQ